MLDGMYLGTVAVLPEAIAPVFHLISHPCADISHFISQRGQLKYGIPHLISTSPSIRNYK